MKLDRRDIRLFDYAKQFALPFRARGRRRSFRDDARSGSPSADDTADRPNRLTFLVSATPR
ncbi:MAG: hypothetical protein ACTHQM_16855 [Thermoanaerobaculia bacterium]